MKNLIVKNLLNEVEEFSNLELKRKNDIQSLLDVSLNNGYEEEFEELIFTAKYIEGLKRVLQKGSEFKEVENLDIVRKDLSENIKKIVEQINLLVKKSSPEVKKHFDETYLGLTPQCFANLNQLLSALEWIKKYLNFKKHSS